MRLRRLLTMLAIAALGAVAAAAPATAQMEVTCHLDPAARRVCDSAIGHRSALHEIYHADGTLAGEIYVVRSPGAATYVEHWVLYPRYRYPDVIRPAKDQRYTSERDFLERVPFEPGSRYVKWDVLEQREIPGRGGPGIPPQPTVPPTPPPTGSPVPSTPPTAPPTGGPQPTSPPTGAPGPSPVPTPTGR